jgi:uncharacterized membrane protein YkvI
MRLQKLATLIIIFLFIVNPVASFAQEEKAANGFVDDSIRDMSIVLGAGLAGAVLGLSTLSFVDEPSQHTKNIAVGGAIGVIIGVTVVVLTQASQTSLAQSNLPLNNDNYESIKRLEFKDVKIAENYFYKPSINYSFTF